MSLPRMCLVKSGRRTAPGAMRWTLLFGAMSCAFSAQAELICGISSKSIVFERGCSAGGRYRLSMNDIQKDPTLAANTVGGLAAYGLRFDFENCKLADGRTVNGSIAGEVREYNGIQESGSCRPLPRRDGDPLVPGYYEGSLTASMTMNGRPVNGNVTFSLQEGVPTAVTRVNGRGYVDRGDGTYELPIDRIMRAYSPVPESGLWAVTSEINGQPGRGFQLEVSSNVLVATVYGYEGGGDPVFHLASGTLNAGTASGELIAYRGGTSFGGPSQPAANAGSPGSVRFAFTDSTHGTVTFPGEAAQAVRKFDWADPVDQTEVPAKAGLWAVESEINGQPGRGLQIETQNGVMVVTVYGYDAAGKGTFYLASGSLANDAFSAPLKTYRGGRSFGGVMRSATEAGTAGTLSLKFTSDTGGEVTFPGESPKRIRKFTW